MDKKEYKTTEAQRKANAKWDKANKDKKNYINKKSITKNFILKTATLEDIENAKTWINSRLNEEKNK
ncbi:hypothetical protein [Finegoldia magna]|uniref:hypothetical protein n=1 Tax=Finegoldia magna TaxID=1260 RepID=UPI000B916292|nr:hypothetical protein [Finegoldia magna]OXZ39988.1 hypothetical protein B9N50_00085 [Finegoldia magna]